MKTKKTNEPDDSMMIVITSDYVRFRYGLKSVVLYGCQNDMLSLASMLRSVKNDKMVIAKKIAR